MDTLAYHKTRPLKANIDISGVNLRDVMANYHQVRAHLEIKEDAPMAKPEREALWFYVQQHAMGLIEKRLDDDEPLGPYECYVENYHSTIQNKAIRMFYYILLICTRESRHAMSTSWLYSQYPDIHLFHQNHVTDSSADAAVQAVIDNAPDVSLGNYVDFLVEAFESCTYSSGYGGESWHDVARPLKQYVYGEISAEIFMDTAFTLAHNNGPIFNKGMLYTGFNSSSIAMILDVQRSGQIPQLISDSEQHALLTKTITPALREYVENFSGLEPGFTGGVDWSIVRDVHGTRPYKHLITEKKPSTIQEKLAEMKEQAQATAKKMKALAAKAALLKGSFEVMPGVLIPKGTRSHK